MCQSHERQGKTVNFRLEESKERSQINIIWGLGLDPETGKEHLWKNL